jgi:FeS assembly SUF system protein
MSEQEPVQGQKGPKDEEFEKLKRRRLGVLNAEPQETAPFALEDPGLAPDSAHSAPRMLKDRIVQGLRTVYDPEIPLNIYDLGLVYDLDVGEDGAAHVRMTLTAPGCPVAGSLVREVHDRVRATPGVSHAKTELVWDPPWTRDRMSLEAQLELGLL